MMISLVGFQIVLPLVLIVGLAIAPPHNRLGFLLQALVTAITLVAIARLGIWMFPPWWTRYFYGVLLVVALVVGRRQLKLSQPLPSHWLGWGVIVAFVAFGVFIGNAALQSWAGRLPPPLPVVDLTFPLRGDGYLIVHGGSNIQVNPHMKTLDESVPRFRAYRGQSYGVDIIQINRFGLRANGILPDDLAAYRIYGDPVLAPCAGTIVQAVDDFPDMPIPQADQENRAGNHVILRCGEVDVLLAHFRPQSLAVQSGMDVQVGDRLAEVGNSGASNEPHLHISAQRPGSSDAPLSGEPLPMRFAGQFLIRGDCITQP
ncbi:MAG: M23 family metallopeptidase [Elainellaceae cyanobacterium]